MLQALLLGSCLLLPAIHGALFPPPTGNFNTSLTITQLTDYTRRDPYAPTPQPRSLMVSVFQPTTCTAGPTPYMDPLTAAFVDANVLPSGVLPPGTFESLSFFNCPTIPRHQEKPFPLLLFSTGMGDPRLYYSFLAQAIASTGYVVITIDHPFDANIVVYPNNRTVLAANITNDEQSLTFDLNVRTQDVIFVLDEVSRPSLTEILPGFEQLDVSRVGVFGHSLGGATAAQAMFVDERFAGGMNLDGMMFGSVVHRGLHKPFVLWGHTGHSTLPGADFDLTWATFWSKLTGFKRELSLEGSAHGTFTDLPEVVDVLGLSGILPPEVSQLLGTIDGTRALKVISTYVVSFFDFVLKGKGVGLLEGPSPEFPEVIFVNH